MKTLYTDTLESPCGPLLVAVDEAGALVRIDFLNGKRPAQAAGAREVASPERTAPVRRQLEEYFAGRRREFELELAPEGTGFERSVWEELRRIPFGETRSYGELARALGRPGAARAVGRANGANPIPIVVPCHRVIGADGSLTGFGGGLAAKEALLALEGRPSPHPRPLSQPALPWPHLS